MNILITGGAGFIGSRLAEILLKKGHDVYVIDNLSTGERKRVPKGAHFSNMDIRDTKKVSRYMDRHAIERVFHLAALARIQRSWDLPELTYDVNVNGTMSILMSAQQAGINDVFITSSSSVLAGISLQENPHPITTDAQPLPLNPYAFHKYLNEKQAEMVRECWSMNIKVGRL